MKTEIFKESENIFGAQFYKKNQQAGLFLFEISRLMAATAVEK